MEKRHTIVVMQGDQTGQELLDEALRVLTPGILPLDGAGGWGVFS